MQLLQTMCKQQKYSCDLEFLYKLTFAFVFLLLLLTEFVQGQLIQVQAVKVACQNLGKCLHGEGPLCDQLLPAGERGEYRQQVVPQLPRDVHVQIPFDPGHNQSLNRKTDHTVWTTSEPLTDELEIIILALYYIIYQIHFLNVLFQLFLYFNLKFQKMLCYMLILYYFLTFNFNLYLFQFQYFI